MMVTFMSGFFDSTLASARPPTPPPAIKTSSGLSGEISSTYDDELPVGMEGGGTVAPTERTDPDTNDDLSTFYDPRYMKITN